MTGTVASLQLQRLPSLDSLQPEVWDDLWLRSQDCTIFQKYGWIRAWWKTFREDTDELFLLCVTQTGQPVGLAPLFLRRQAGRATLRFLGDGPTDYANFLVDRRTPQALDLLLQFIFDPGAPWSETCLSEIPESTPLGSRLLALSKGLSGRTRLLFRTPCPRLLLGHEGANVDLLLKKQSVKRNCSRLRSLGPLDVFHLDKKEAIRPLLADFFQQHIKRWSPTSHPSLFLDLRYKTFYSGLLEHLCDDGCLVLSVLNLQGRNIAYHFGLISKNSFIWYKPSFDTEFSKYSPGEVLLKELLVMVRQRGLSVFDFTRGDESFKRRFANDIHWNGSFCWYAHRATRMREGLSQGLRRVARALVPRSLAARRRQAR